MAHTPGPWFYHEPINSKRRDFGVTAGRQYDPSRGAVRRIAWVGNASNPNAEVSEEVRANAVLMAAAPDMLAALKGAKIIAEFLPWPDDLGNDVRASLSARLHAIDAAISNAEGGNALARDGGTK